MSWPSMATEYPEPQRIAEHVALSEVREARYHTQAKGKGKTAMYKVLIPTLRTQNVLKKLQSKQLKGTLQQVALSFAGNDDLHTAYAEIVRTAITRVSVHLLLPEGITACLTQRG